MEESPRIIRVNNPRDKLCKDDEEAQNCRFSDDGSLDNLASRNNDVRVGTPLF